MMLRLLEIIAFNLIKKHKPVVICITGSVGKTSTKEAIASCLSASFTVRKTPKNINNEYGVPISIIGNFKFKEGFWAILEIIINGIGQYFFNNDFPQALVIEVGSGKVGEIQRVSKWLKPDILVVTNLPDIPSHVGVFGDVEKVVREKKNLADVMDGKGVLFMGMPGKFTNIFLEDYKGQTVLCYSKMIAERLEYAIRYKNIDETSHPVGINIGIKFAGNLRSILYDNFLGTQNNQAIFMALMVAEKLKCKTDNIIKGLSKYMPEAGRLRILLSKFKGVTIIDDSYNSSPIAVDNSLANFLAIKTIGTQRRIAVLGDMFNLGNQSTDIHRNTAKNKVEDVDILLTVGDLAEVWQSRNTNATSMNKHFRRSIDAAKYLKVIQKFGDLILFKGGHLTRLEKAVSELSICNSDDLVRQEKYWQKDRFELFSK